MGNKDGAYIIEGLLDREYLNKFSEIDPNEQKRVLMVAIKTASILFDLSLIHISEPTRLGFISYAVFCLKKTFFNDTATTEIYTQSVVGSVRCV